LGRLETETSARHKTIYITEEIGMENKEIAKRTSPDLKGYACMTQEEFDLYHDAMVYIEEAVTERIGDNQYYGGLYWEVDDDDSEKLLVKVIHTPNWSVCMEEFDDTNDDEVIDNLVAEFESLERKREKEERKKKSEENK